MRVRAVTRIIAATCLVMLAGFGPRTAAQSSDLGDRKVSLDVKDELLDMALLQLFQSAKVRYVLTRSAALAAAVRVTAKIDTVSLRRALPMLFGAAGVAGRFSAAVHRGEFVVDAEPLQQAPQSPAPPAQQQPLVTISLRDTSLDQALIRVCRAANTACTIHPLLLGDLGGVRVTTRFARTPLDVAVARLLAKAPDAMPPTRQEFADRELLITPRFPMEADEGLLAREVGLSAGERSERAAVLSLLRKAGVSYAVSLDPLARPLAGAAVVRQPLGQALLAVLRAADPSDQTAVSCRGGVVLVAPYSRIGRPTAPGVHVSAHFHLADVRYALGALFEIAGYNYTLDPDVVGPVSVDIDDLSVEGAVKSVLRHAQAIAPLQSSIDNGVYIVFPEMHARGG